MSDVSKIPPGFELPNPVEPVRMVNESDLLTPDEATMLLRAIQTVVWGDPVFDSARRKLARLAGEGENP